MSHICNLKIKASGSEYVFKVYKIDKFKYIEEENVIYAFLKTSPSLSGYSSEILYVGQTTQEFSNRAKYHHKWKKALSMGFNTIGICPVDGRSIKRIEKEIIRVTNPPCNDIKYQEE